MRISDWSSDVCSSDLYEESFRLPGTSAADLDAGFAHDGKEHLDAALALGNGAIMAMPHLGGWEWAGFWPTQVEGVPVSVVGEQREPPEPRTEEQKSENQALRGNADDVLSRNKK